MVYNIDFDIAALFIFSAMLFIFYYKKCVPNVQNKIFSAILWVSFFASIADILDGVMTANLTYFTIGSHYVVIYVYYLLINALPILYTLYVLAVTGIEGQILKSVRSVALLVPAALSLGMILLNPFTRWLFYFDDQHQYHRPGGIALMNVLALYFLLYGTVEVFRYRKAIRRKKCIGLYSFAIFASVPVLIQSMMPNVFITMFGISICVFLIFMTIQSPEEVLSETGLLNRGALLSTAEIYFKRKERFYVLSIVLRDYQYLKRVFGTPIMGDFLNEVAHLLERFPMNGKQTYYLGDGKFALLCPAQEMRKGVPERLLALFESEVSIRQMKMSFAVRVCVINCPKDAAYPDALMQYAEEFDKRMGEEQVLLSASQIALSSRDRAQEVERAIELALAAGGLSVHYQPIYSTKEKGVHSAEALVRLVDPVLGPLYPDEFIPIAERNGAILRIGMFVFRSVCEFYVQQKLVGRGIRYIQINLSVAQCMQKDLAEQLLEVLQEYGISPECINLEVTETTAAGSPETLLHTMRDLSSAGLKFSLDDYGTGYSNLSSLIELPFTLVKIDKGMVWKLNNERAQIAMSHTISMLKQLCMGIVAEGVETEEQADLLTKMGCDYLQGYYYSKPMPEAEFLTQLERFKQTV